MPNLCVRGPRSGEAAGRDHPAGLTAGSLDVVIIVPYPSNWMTAVVPAPVFRSLSPGLVRVRRTGRITVVARLQLAKP